MNNITWRITELKIRQYPQKKKEYEEYISDIMSNTGSSIKYKSKKEGDNKPQSTVEAAALKMSSRYADKAKKDIEAIEYVYNNLKPEEQKIMRVRFWRDPKKSTPYLKMKECAYSERQMKRIVFKIINQVAKQLGEIQ